MEKMEGDINEVEIEASKILSKIQLGKGRRSGVKLHVDELFLPLAKVLITNQPETRKIRRLLIKA